MTIFCARQTPVAFGGPLHDVRLGQGGARVASCGAVHTGVTETDKGSCLCASGSCQGVSELFRLLAVLVIGTAAVSRDADRISAERTAMELAPEIESDNASIGCVPDTEAGGSGLSGKEDPAHRQTGKDRGLFRRLFRRR